MDTLKPVEVSKYYIDRVASGMCRYFWDNIFKGIFDILKENNSVYNYNPYHDEKGRFCNSIRAKMPMLTDYQCPTKDYELSPIPLEFLNKLGKKQKPLILKKNIIEKNKNNHPEIDIEEYNDILLNGIYKADVMFKTDSKSEYFNFVHYNEGHNPQVLIELSETKNNYEIVNFHWLRDKSLKEKLNRAIKRVDNEGDQVLIDNEKFSQVGGLSNLEIDSIYIINHFRLNFNLTVENSKDDVINALKSGRIWYENGAFRTKTRFSSKVSATLEAMGARFRYNAYYIAESAIPFEYVEVLTFIKAQNAIKAEQILQYLGGLSAVLAGLSLEDYIKTVVEFMFKKLELDILKSAQEAKIPVIELGIVQPKVKIPKAKSKPVEQYWKEQDKKANELRKEIKEAEKKGKETADLKDKLEEQQKNAYQNAPQVDVEIDNIELFEKSKKIAQDYTYNMQYWVKKWEVKNIIEMRKDVLKMVQQGARYERIQEYFEKRWGIAKNKAYFLAKNESDLAGSVIKATDYQELGCPGYVWGRSSAREKRELHKHYYGKFFTWEDKPIIDEKLGIRGYPRQIWNCSCHMLIKPPTMSDIIQKHTKIRNAKRNIFTKIKYAITNGKQCDNNAWRYRRFGEGQTL